MADASWGMKYWRDEAGAGMTAGRQECAGAPQRHPGGRAGGVRAAARTQEAPARQRGLGQLLPPGGAASHSGYSCLLPRMPPACGFRQDMGDLTPQKWHDHLCILCLLVPVS